MPHKFTLLAILTAGGLWLASAATAQQPKTPGAAPGRGEARGEQDAPPMPRPGSPREGRPGEFGSPPRRPGTGNDPRGPFREGEGRRGPEGRPGPGFPGGPFGPGIPGQDLRRMQQDDPEMYKLLASDSELDGQALEISEQLRRAPSDEREKLKTALSDVVIKHFEVRQKRRELQLKRMEDEIKRLRDAIEARNAARDEIVNKRITELTGDANPLDF